MPNEGELPAWVRSLQAELADVPAQQGSSRAASIPVSTDYLPGAYGAVVTAAKARKLSTAAYVRRAALAMAAFDLEIPLIQLLERDPRMSRETGLPVSDPRGRRFGPWVITGLKADPE